MSATAAINKIQNRASGPNSPYVPHSGASNTLKPLPVNGLAKANAGQGRPYSTYSSQAATLKRIKSELETIQERKEDKDPNDGHDHWVEGPIMENILLDESYSFSLRQFEQQKSKRGDL